MPLPESDGMNDSVLSVPFMVERKKKVMRGRERVKEQDTVPDHKVFWRVPWILPRVPES